MGEVADMVLDGILCQYCGQYTGHAPGYPTNCEDCDDEELKED